MQFGRSYEEFEVGATYRHWPGKTVTEYDDHLFCLLTMNHHPLHLDANYARETTQFGQNVVVGNYVYSILLGMSVPDVSGKAIANLEVESLRHVAPTFHGDTLYGETTVLDKRESTSKDDRGVVHVETIGYKQDGTVVCIFRRKVMVPEASPTSTRAAASSRAARRRSPTGTGPAPAAPRRPPPGPDHPQPGRQPPRARGGRVHRGGVEPSGQVAHQVGVAGGRDRAVPERVRPVAPGARQRQEHRHRGLDVDVAALVQQWVPEAAVGLGAVLEHEPVPPVEPVGQAELQDDRPPGHAVGVHPLGEPAEHDVRVPFPHVGVVGEPRLRPGAQRAERAHQAVTDRSESVGRVRVLGVGARHQTQRLQAAQPIREHGARDPPGQPGDQVVEPLRPEGPELAHDEQAPPVTQVLDRLGVRAVAVELARAHPASLPPGGPTLWFEFRTGRASRGGRPLEPDESTPRGHDEHSCERETVARTGAPAAAPRAL